MRQVGTLGSEQHARRFADYLLTRGIHSSIEREDGQWVVWIHEEDHVDDARDEFARFRERPDDSTYAGAAGRAADLRKQDERKAKQVRRNVVDVAQRWSRPVASRCPITSAMLLGCVLVALLTRFGDGGREVIQALSIADYEIVGNRVRPSAEFADIRRGEVWRLVTPVFLHFGLLHFAFNVYMFFHFGTLVETLRGSARFALLVVTFALVSNLAQYLARGPSFGGMSGVLYGLFGYAWMKSRFDPASAFFVPPSTVFILMAWFFLGMTGMVGPIANFAHGGGLVTGMMLGYAPKFWRDLTRK
ncbi:MAG TPA: rhomboid family intramembrane serine protease [Planctomycetaceae bacterium]|nr:rhomboid family intramembrane serine protease [Planctomycetaceae bacterium]